MKFDEFFSIWSKFLSAFGNAKHDLDKSEQPATPAVVTMSTLRRPGHMSYETNTLSSSASSSSSSSAAARTVGTTNRFLNPSSSYNRQPHNILQQTQRTVSIESTGANNFDRLCTDVRQCKYLPTSSSSSPPNQSNAKFTSSWTPNSSRVKIRSINDFNLPNCRSSSES